MLDRCCTTKPFSWLLVHFAAAAAAAASVSLACRSSHGVCVWCPWRSERHAGFHRTEVTDALSYHVGTGN